MDDFVRDLEIAHMKRHFGKIGGQRGFKSYNFVRGKGETMKMTESLRRRYSEKADRRISIFRNHIDKVLSTAQTPITDKAAR